MPCRAGASLYPELSPCLEETNSRHAAENLQPKGILVTECAALGYLCHAKVKGPNQGDLALFYRSKDQHRITTLGVVEACETCTDPDVIARMVRRRTVYSMDEIDAMTDRPVKVILFRAVRHFPNPPTLPELTRLGVLKGAPITMVQITHSANEKLRELACV